MSMTWVYAAWVVKMEIIRVNLLNTYTLHLFKTNRAPTPLDSRADYTEANFDGYAPIPLTDWGPSYLNAGNKVETDTGVHTFTMTGNVTPNTIYGYYIWDAGGAVVGGELNPAGGFLLDAAGKTFSVKLSDTGF